MVTSWGSYPQDLGSNPSCATIWRNMEEVKKLKAAAATSSWEIVKYVNEHSINKEDIVQIVQTDNNWIVFYYG